MPIIVKEVGDRAGEGKAYGNLGNAYHSLGKFQEAIEYHNQDLSIAKEVGDRAGEGKGLWQSRQRLWQPWKIPRSHRVPSINACQ